MSSGLLWHPQGREDGRADPLKLLLSNARRYDGYTVKLPNGDRAFVDIRKPHEYCLSSRHPRGRHKARVFAAVGIREADAEELREALLDAALRAEVESGNASPYGQRFVLDFDFVRKESTVRIRSTWIVRTGEDSLRLTSCYVL